MLLLIFEDFLSVNITQMVGIILILIACFRMRPLPNIIGTDYALKYKKIWYSMIGGIHGCSNLGGAPLTALMSALHSDQKTLNANVAFIYFSLALSQMVVLTALEVEHFEIEYLGFIPLVISIHIVTNYLVGGRINKTVFDGLITLMILVFGFLCLF
tara:strand:- start:29 stop:499 length:471 start_codon:yes stop_codon:yes gene_type:complete